MKPFYPVLLCMAFCFNAGAQSTKQADKSAKQAALAQRKAAMRARDSIIIQTHAQSRMSAKLNLFNLFDPETPTIQPGIEFRISKRVSAEVTVGIPARIHGNVRLTDSTYNNYYKLKFELRYFPFDRRAFYIAPELAYINVKRSKYDGEYVSKSDHTYQYDYAEIEKTVFAFAVKGGVVAPFRKNNRWFFDVFFGLGPRFVNMKIKAVNPQPAGSGFFIFNVSNEQEGTTTRLHAPGGLKIGYVLF